MILECKGLRVGAWPTHTRSHICAYRGERQPVGSRPGAVGIEAAHECTTILWLEGFILWEAPSSILLHVFVFLFFVDAHLHLREERVYISQLRPTSFRRLWS